MKKSSRLACASVILLGLLGCSSDGKVDLGTTAKTGERLSDYVAVWDGHAEAHTYTSGSDRFRLSLDAAGDGVLTLGDVAEATPATSASDVVPGTWPVPAFTSSPLFEGWQYAVGGAAVEANRLKLNVSYAEPYVDWCALQTPVANGSDYTCAPEGARGDQHGNCTIEVGSSSEPFDCGALALCQGGPCACTEMACAVTTPVVLPNELDASLGDDGNTLTGTFVDDKNVRYTVRMTRQED